MVTAEDIGEREWYKETHSDIVKIRETIPPVTEINTINQERFLPTPEEKKIWKKLLEQQKKVKTKFYSFYVHSKMNFILDLICKNFPSPKKIFTPNGEFDRLEGNRYYLKSIYVIGKARIEINNQMVALSEYITWTYQNYTTDPVERMKHSVVVILHQDKLLIENSLKEIATLFEQSLLLANTDDQFEKLQNQVMLIRYLFAHAMPFPRGSASVAEWYEKLIYLFHGHICKHNLQTIGDAEALVAPLWSTFGKRYHSTIELDK